MLEQKPSNWKDRLRASGIHLGLSLCIAALAAWLVFGLWYPYPYREISGGRELFLIVIAVDVILGPLITLVVFNRAKPWTELRRDLIIVVLIQLAALGYGLWTVWVARPVHLVFEYKLFRVVHAIDIPVELLDKTPTGITALPMTGPTLLSLRPFKDSGESMDATLAAVGGGSLSARPDLWQPYEAASAEIRREAKPVSDLKARFAAHAAAIDAVIAAKGRKPESLVYLPLVGRKTFWTVFLDPTNGDVVAFMPLDSF
ncbi:MAG: pilus assembly protein [Rhodoferax sp.]|nr:pilus assembly protein [Rhodoferax sp.]